MSWYTVSLTQADVSLHRNAKIQDEFEVLFMAHQAPKDAAMFAESSAGNINYDIYFSPTGEALASSLIASYGGKTCLPPTVEVSLLVGHADARKRLLQN